jgi:DNA-binding FrmR family transcriptional regulator
MAHLSTDNDALIKRVRRLIGQLQAIERALAEGDDCTTTLHLAAAARGAMGGLIEELIDPTSRPTFPPRPFRAGTR